MNYYDLEAIRRFVDTITKNEEEILNAITYKLASKQQVEPDERDKNTLNGVDLADIRAAHRALAALLAGADLKKELGITQKRGPKKKQKLNDQSGQVPEFMVLCSLEGGAIRYHEAVEMFMDYWGVGETTAEEFIRDRRKSAKRLVDSFMKHAPPGCKPFLSKEALIAALDIDMHQ